VASISKEIGVKYPDIHTIIVQSSAVLKGILPQGRKKPVQCVEVKNYTIPDGAEGPEHYVKNALSAGTK
jgi:hypothetical protein